MAYRAVHSVAELKDGVRRGMHILNEKLRILLNVQELERKADQGDIIGVAWPIDAKTDVLVYDVLTDAGPIATLDDELDGLLHGAGVSVRYQYTIKPGRPAEYVVGRLFPGITGTGQPRMWIASNDLDIALAGGGPFLKVENAAGATAGDKVGIRIPTSPRVFAEYDNIVVAASFWAGYGLMFDVADFNHLTNGVFAGDANYWYLETLGDPGNWVYAAGAVNTGGAATSGSFWQDSANLTHPFVSGVTYRVRFGVLAWTAGTIMPSIGSAAGIAVGAAGVSYIQYITCTEDNADLIMTGAVFHGTIDNIHVQPIYKEHISDGAFDFDPAAYSHWTLGAGWAWATGPPRTMTAVAATSSLTQSVANQVAPIAAGVPVGPFVNDEVYTVVVSTITGAGGTIKPRIGIGEGHDITPGAGAEYHTWEVTADDYGGTVALDFELVATAFSGIVYTITVFKNEPDPNGGIEVILQQSDE